MGVTLDQYRAAETPEDGFAISRPDDLGHLRFGVHLHLDYAYNPLVWEADQGDLETQEEAIVAHQLVGTVGASLGLINRIVVFLGLPVTLAMAGEENPSGFSADGFALGDLYLGGRLRILGTRESLFSLGFQATLTTPTAAAARAGQAFAGERTVTGHPELLAEIRPGPVRITLNVGARFRRGSDYGTFSTGHAVTYGLGLTYDVIPMLDIHAELYGTHAFNTHNPREATNMEAIAGVRLHPIEGSGLNIGLAGGLGLLRGAGSPAARAVLTVGWTMAPRDGDGGDDGDSDHGDGPEVGAECTGVADCPEGDLDEDGILNGVDQCPTQPEDFDQFEDENGCPDTDNDGDEILDGDDACPDEAGTPENQGCPRAARVDEGRIIILQRIEFETSSDELLSHSIPILEDVRAVIAENPQIRRVRIEGHTDNVGNEEANIDLSRRRAGTVGRWLLEHGIEESRLVAEGFGEGRPVATNDTDAGRQSNRRVEFHIVDNPTGTTE